MFASPSARLVLLLLLAPTWGCGTNVAASMEPVQAPAMATTPAMAAAGTRAPVSEMPTAPMQATPVQASPMQAAAGTPSAPQQGSDPAAGSGGAGAPAAAAGSGGDGASGALAQAGAAGSEPADTAPRKVFIASDSTASNYKDTGRDDDQAGWGQMLPELVQPQIEVDNRAIGGRTARRFIDEGRLDEIWNDIATGDFLLVQFGTNDGHRTATYEIDGQTIPYYLDPATDFKTYVRRYIAGAKERGAVPVLVTPPPRNSAYCTGGNGTNAHAEALRELGESDDVGVVDLNRQTVMYLQAICPEPTPPDFFLQRADGTVDGTHFQERGARQLAGFVAAGLRDLGATWIKD
jgi:lysophospholipase L1-like esterase